MKIREGYKMVKIGTTENPENPELISHYLFICSGSAVGGRPRDLPFL